MDAHRISSSPIPAAVQLSSICAVPATAHGNGPLSESASACRADAVDSKTHSSPETALLCSNEGQSNSGNFSLTSNRGGGGNATTNSSWDAAGDASNLTFSQVSPPGARSTFLFDLGNRFPSQGPDGDLFRNRDSPQKEWNSPRKRGDAAVTFVAFRSAADVSAAEEGRSDTLASRAGPWEPQGLLGGALQHFESPPPEASCGRPGAASMGGAVLGNEEPDDLPPEPSVSNRHQMSSPSVHAIQFDPDYRGNTTPFMSISSPGVSRQSVSRVRMSVPQLSTGSMGMGMSYGSFEAPPVIAISTVARGSMMPPSSVASPVRNNDTLAGAQAGSQRPYRGKSIPSPRRETRVIPAPSALVSPRFDTTDPLAVRSPCRTGTSTGSQITGNASTAAGEEERTPLHGAKDFFEPAGSHFSSFRISHASTPTTTTKHAAAATAALPKLPARALPVLEGEVAERMQIERAEAVDSNKLRSMEVSEFLVQSRKDRVAARRASKYAGTALQRQLVADEKEQLNSSMRARMRAAEAEHQQSMRSFRQMERVNAAPGVVPPNHPARSRVASSQRSSSLEQPQGGSPVGAHPIKDEAGGTPTLPALRLSPLHSMQHLPRAASPSPPRVAGSCDTQLAAEIQRQRLFKQQFTPCSSVWKRDLPFQKLQ